MKKVINFILTTILVLILIFIFIAFQKGFNFDEMMINGIPYSLTKFESYIFITLLSIIAYVAVLITPPFNFIVFYLIYNRVVKNKIRKNSKFDKQNLEYCREHLNKMSPEIISYLNNFTIEVEKDISAHILKLLYEGYLVEENNSFKTTNKDISILSKADQLVIEMVREKDFGFVKIKQYEKAIESEVVFLGLITLKNKKWKNLGIKFLIFIFSFPFIFNFIPLLLPLINQGSEKIAIYVILVWVLMFLIMSFVVAYFIANLISLLKNKTLYIRTSKGNKILKNSWSLEKFLRDFGALDKSSYKEVYTREYFLIYAVVLKVNQIIPEEIMKKIK